MSGIYIHGIEMPKNEEMVVIINRDGTVIFKNALSNSWSETNAVPVPPHGRLIDADAFVEDECNSCDGACEEIPCDCLNCTADCRCDFMKDVANASTIIPAEEDKQNG